ncbi:hypothetical protein [Candidatus Nitrosocosmicus sp. T]
MKQKNTHHYVLLILGILFSIITHNNTNIIHDSTFFPNVYGHNFPPNNYASFVASLDQFQIESNLVQSNLLNHNITLAQKHADEAVSIFYWDLLVEIVKHDKKIGDDLKTAVENLRNLTASFPDTPLAVQGEKQRIEQSNQLIASINTNVDKIIAITETQKQSEDSNLLNQVTTFISNIFSQKNDNSNGSIHPMRFAEGVDNVLRNYGDAYGVDFDMTDMINMEKMGNMNQQSAIKNSNSYDSNNSSDMNMSIMNMSSSMKDSDTKMSTNKHIVNMANYQSANGMAEKLSYIFNKELKPTLSQNGTAFYGTNLESGIIQLENAIEYKVSPMDIMMIVHTQIHPNLIGAFDLQILSNA